MILAVALLIDKEKSCQKSSLPLKPIPPNAPPGAACPTNSLPINSQSRESRQGKIRSPLGFTDSTSPELRNAPAGAVFQPVAIVETEFLRQAMALVWSNELSVGNAVIDSEHRNLIVMVISLDATIRAKDGSSLSHELEQIEYWLRAHFKNEKRIAAAVGLDSTRIESVHENLLDEFRRMKDKLNALSGMWSDRIAKQCYQYLCDWITGHIIREDMLMKPVLKEHEYNFCG